MRQGVAIDTGRSLGRQLFGEACIDAHLLNLQKAAKPLLERDRVAYLDKLAASASQAIYDCDSRQAFAVIRSLSGRAARPPQNVQRPDGRLTESPQ